MANAWNPEKKFFCQSYEDKDVVDSAVLIMPLVFFCAAVSELVRTLIARREALKSVYSLKKGFWAL